ncbi:MAG: hypothetical protein QWI36_04090 [Wolbachia endosymbiont of Tyrophagus putrescentiae]|nr:hypothetical protein [Wolbachia endosymbiont of Tyrophagus putrescentiae]
MKDKLQKLINRAGPEKICAFLYDNDTKLPLLARIARLIEAECYEKKNGECKQTNWLCPIMYRIAYKKPVRLKYSNGSESIYLFENDAIKKCIKTSGMNCPITGQRIKKMLPEDAGPIRKKVFTLFGKHCEELQESKELEEIYDKLNDYMSSRVSSVLSNVVHRFAFFLCHHFNK